MGELKEDMVKCLLCQKVMSADKFVDHALLMHEDEVLGLVANDTIIEKLSEWK